MPAECRDTVLVFRMVSYDVRELEDMNLIPEEKGGFTFMVNGSMTPLSSAGAAYAKNIEKKEDNAE